MSDLENITYEQAIALRVISDTPDMEGSEICKKADCSFEELHSLADKGFIDLGSERIKKFAIHPALTDTGQAALELAKETGIIDA